MRSMRPHTGGPALIAVACVASWGFVATLGAARPSVAAQPAETPVPSVWAGVYTAAMAAVVPV